MASEYLVAVPEVTDPGSAVVLTPASYATWAACVAANTSKDSFIFTPGNYGPTGANWGRIAVAAAQGHGTAQRRRLISYVDPYTPPWRRIGTEALIEGFDFGSSSPSPAHFWIMHGMTMRGTSGNGEIWFSSHDIIVDSCLIEEFTGVYGIRARLGSADYRVQRTVIRNAQGALRGDSIGVQIRCNAPDQTPRGRVVDCEIYNVGDPVQVTAADSPDEALGVDGTIIDNNDLYTTSGWYSDGAGNDTPSGGYAYSENGADIKAGSEDANDPCILSNNRIWGYRTTDTTGGGSGSDGVGLVSHVYARNWRVWDNVVFDCAGGLRESVWAADPQVSRNIDYRRNVIQGIRKYIAADNGYALNIRLTETLVGNVIAGCTTLAYQDVASGQAAHAMHGNQTFDTPLGSYATAWAASGNNQARATGDMQPLIVVRKRLTGPETVVLPGCVYREPLGGAGWALGSTYARSRRRR